MDALHLKDRLVLFGCEGSALSLPIFLSHALPLTMTLNRLMCRCAFQPSFIHSFIHYIWLKLMTPSFDLTGSRGCARFSALLG